MSLRFEFEFDSLDSSLLQDEKISKTLASKKNVFF